MGAAKKTVKKTVKKKAVNTSQPSYILKQKQLATLRALMAEEKRKEQMRREFEAFLAAQATNTNNNNWYFSNHSNRSRKTRKLRR